MNVPHGKKLEVEDDAYDPASAFDDESPPEDEQYDPFAEYQTSEFLVEILSTDINLVPSDMKNIVALILSQKKQN